MNKKIIDKSQWIWMPHPGHFIAANDCNFRMNTYVNGFIISTVGELKMQLLFRVEEIQDLESIKKSSADLLGRNRRQPKELYEGLKIPDLLDEYDDIGCFALYETMVFTAKKNESTQYFCCPYEMGDDDLYTRHYNDPGDAYKGHLKMCEFVDSLDEESKESFLEGKLSVSELLEGIYV